MNIYANNSTHGNMQYNNVHKIYNESINTDGTK